MKIAFLNIYQDTIKRGVETFVSEIGKRISNDTEVDIISGGEIVVPEWKKTILWRLFLDRNSIEILKFTFKNLPKILKNKYDIVIPMNGGWQSIVVRIATWTYGGKVVVVGQSGNGWHDRINLLTFPNTFVSLTKVGSKWATKVNPFVKVVDIPNGVDLDKFNLKKKVGGKIKTVISISAFTKEKRNDLTIQAVSKLENVKLIIVGGGGELRNETIKVGTDVLGEDRFECLTVDYSKIPELLSKADVLAFPSSSWESFGIVLVEAMASGLPVVATDDPIRREIVGEAGLFVDPTDIEVYAKVLEKALNTNWGNKPRKQAEKFGWDSIVKQYEELFEKLIR